MAIVLPDQFHRAEDVFDRHAHHHASTCHVKLNVPCQTEGRTIQAIGRWCESVQWLRLTLSGFQITPGECHFTSRVDSAVVLKIPDLRSQRGGDGVDQIVIDRKAKNQHVVQSNEPLLVRVLSITIALKPASAMMTFDVGQRHATVADFDHARKVLNFVWEPSRLNGDRTNVGQMISFGQVGLDRDTTLWLSNRHPQFGEQLIDRPARPKALPDFS